MIKYDGVKSVYYYNPEDLKNVMNILDNVNFNQKINCTQENVLELVNAINSFVTSIKMEKQTAILERHETEEEARKYFGQEFIDKFDKLMTELDKQETIVAIHGTVINNCPKICETGLRYKLPSLNGTTVQQQMAFGQGDMHYQKYETLLNWPHSQYKGLVIIAVPYECYYKEGLWNHFQHVSEGASVSVQDYRIDPDFIVGFIDVVGKKIVINPKYNRKHNYNGYDKDIDIFKENEEIDNEKLKQEIIQDLIESKTVSEKNTISHEIFLEEKEPIDMSNGEDYVEYIVEELHGIIHSINFGYNCMSEEKYKELLVDLRRFYDIKNILHLLKTNEQVKEEIEMFNETTSKTQSLDSNENIEFDSVEKVNGESDLMDFVYDTNNNGNYLNDLMDDLIEQRERKK